jgi:hypothetical protein
MSEVYQSLSHSNGTASAMVFVPKGGRKSCLGKPGVIGEPFLKRWPCRRSVGFSSGM